jgi:hypothetical protein
MSILLAAMLAAGANAGTSYDGLNKTAACVIRHDRIGAAKFADAEPGSAQEREAKAAISPSIARCGGDIDGGRLAGMIAERFYRDVTYQPSPPPADAGGEATLANLVLNRAANAPKESAAFDCLVALRPLPASNLVGSYAGSSRERAAMQSIAEAMGMCVATGDQIRLVPIDFRMGVARALFRRMSVADLIARGG